MTNTPTKRPIPPLLLIPHVVSCVCFAAAFVWMGIVETNRSEPDLYLAVAGYIALAFAVIASFIAFWRVFTRPEASRAWPWIGLHIAGLVLAAYLAIDWFGSHIA
jgi:uncharacterized membrane protein